MDISAQTPYDLLVALISVLNAGGHRLRLEVVYDGAGNRTGYAVCESDSQHPSESVLHCR